MTEEEKNSDIVYKIYDIRNQLLFVCNTPKDAREFITETFGITFRERHGFVYGQLSSDTFIVNKCYQKKHELKDYEKR